MLNTTPSPRISYPTSGNALCIRIIDDGPMLVNLRTLIGWIEACVPLPTVTWLAGCPGVCGSLEPIEVLGTLKCGILIGQTFAKRTTAESLALAITIGFSSYCVFMMDL